MTKSSVFSPLDGLVDLACRDGVEIRPTLLRVLTDLYVQKHPHSAEEEAQYIELALRLLEAVDAPTRKAVAASALDLCQAPRLRAAAACIELAGEPPPSPRRETAKHRSKPRNRPTARSRNHSLPREPRARA